MAIKKYLLVIDYLPARIDELKLIGNYIKKNYSLEMVIISDMLSGDESEFCQYVYQLPISYDGYERRVYDIIASIDMQCVGILPFMDAVSGYAARIANRLGLPGDDNKLSFSGINKLTFREQELVLSKFLFAQSIVLPRWSEVTNYESLLDFFKKCPSGVVIKPVDGRANIGVKVVKSDKDLYESYKNALIEVPNSTIMAEELIDFDSEFSYDGVGNLSFLTQKVCQEGEFPVELGQIVPAQCSMKSKLALIKAGQAINIISGQRYGAFHNEIKLDSKSGQTFLVETNKRPAGMKIWDMANRVFGINLHYIWVDHLLNGYSDTEFIPQAKGSAFLVNLISPIDGKFKDGVIEHVINKTFSLVEKLILSYDCEIIKIKINHGSRFFKEPKTNNDFCGYVCVYINDDKVAHLELMKSINLLWKEMALEYLE